MQFTGPLVATPEGLRTGIGGVPGFVNGYIRLESIGKWTPPFVWSFRAKTLKNLGPDAQFPDGRTVWYDPAFVTHPMYKSNDANVLFTLGRSTGGVGISAELRDERPEQPYGVRTGYADRYRSEPIPGPVFDGKWHDVQVEVDEFARYAMFWDGQLVAEAEELEPATIVKAPVGVALRLDFCDVIIDQSKVHEESPMHYNPDLLTPYGYGTQRVSLGWLRTKLLDNYHPEYVERLVAWLNFKKGRVGVGGGFRADGTQPDMPGFAAEGKSFHQNQQYADGFIGATAVDLVLVNQNPAGIHTYIPWSEVPQQNSAEAATWGVHCNVGYPGKAGAESWHMQPVEIDGHTTWLNNGSPAPEPNYPFPRRTPPIPPVLPPPELSTDMQIMYSTTNRLGTFLIGSGTPVMLSAALAEEFRKGGVKKVVGSGVDEDARWDEYRILSEG